MPDSFSILLGFDFGLRYIGVAVGQTITGSATPLESLLANKGVPDWEEISRLLETWHPSAFIVGLPFKMDGREQFISTSARKFARQLKEHFHLPVFSMDERLTTREAKSQIAAISIQKKQQPDLDSYAAKLILEAWMAQNIN